MIGAFRQSDEIACLGFGINQFAERIAVLRHVYSQGQLRRVDRRVGQGAFDPERAGRKRQSFGANPSGKAQSLSCTGEPERNMNDIVARRYGQGRLGQTGFDNQGMRAVRVGLRAEYPPAQPAGERRASAHESGKTERRLG